jgi:hypothetical protein
MKKKSIWWLSLTKEQQRVHIRKKMAEKNAYRTPSWRGEKYRERGYSEQEIHSIMTGVPI